MNGIRRIVLRFGQIAISMAHFFYLILILNLLLGNALKKLNYLSRYRYLESKSVQNTSRRIFSVSFMETEISV